jgi:hypothetical protein
MRLYIVYNDIIKKGAAMRIALFCLLSSVMISAFGCSQMQTDNPSCPAVKDNAPSVLRHVVLFKFKETSSAAEVLSVVDAFRALPERIDFIRDFEWGTDISPEPYSQGLTHAFLLTFDSEADRDAYLPHPAHQEFGQIAGPHIEKVVVIDYWTKQ